MRLSRRGFLTGMLALGAAPAIVRAASLMKVVTPAGLIWSGVDLARGEDKTCVVTARRQPNGDTEIISADYYVIMHPSAEEAMRELLITGSATVIYRSEVLRRG